MLGRALRALALLALVLVPSLAHATLSIVSQESGGTGHSGGATSPLNWSFPTSGGNVLCVGVVVSYSNASTGVSISATYNGVSMTQVPGSLPLKMTVASEDSYVTAFCLENPANGTNTVSISVSQSSGTLWDILGSAIAFSGAATSNPAGSAVGTAQTAAATSITQSLAGTTAGDIVLSVACTGTSFTGATSPTTSSALLNASSNTTCDSLELGQQSTSGGTVSAGYGFNSDVAEIIAFEIFAAPATVPQPSLLALTGIGGGGGGPASPTDTLPCFYYVNAASGNDSNDGRTRATAFNTLTHAQTQMQGNSVPSQKVACLIGNLPRNYSLSSAIALTSADHDETWQYDPASGVNTAVLDGGGVSADGFDISGNNITINGLKFQNFTTYSMLVGINNPAATTPSADNVTLKNNDVGSMTVAPPAENAAAASCIEVFNATHVTVKGNYVHDCASTGIGAFAFYSGWTIDGLVIDRNVVLNTATKTSDSGAIYMNMRSSVPAGKVMNVSITNNFVRDTGAAGFVSLRDLYFDDDASKITVTGNILGPLSTAINSTTQMEAIFFNGGYGNLISNNIIDLGTTAAEAVWGMTTPGSGDGGNLAYTLPANAQNITQKNIILRKFAGNAAIVGFWANGNFSYDEDPSNSATTITLGNNMYKNYGGGSSTTAAGNVISDTTAVQNDPLCSGYLYTLAGNSPAFSAPLNFIDVMAARTAGPPGFTIPTSPNRSCPRRRAANDNNRGRRRQKWARAA